MAMMELDVSGSTCEMRHREDGHPERAGRGQVEERGQNETGWRADVVWRWEGGGVVSKMDR